MDFAKHADSLYTKATNFDEASFKDATMKDLQNATGAFLTKQQSLGKEEGGWLWQAIHNLFTKRPTKGDADKIPPSLSL
ncbi:hypothetical protein EDM53_04265 [Rickettsiales endosymbiont of Peranema trichophorum]|uniref:hypothetical protein n=1 Tax=Rickettsiales endosymbiont of Peranema trichophorum TaxID=2486577 RepID=UPI001022F336|nr:hypothetical protein [Rickettsiales endosymbiont of Peranema trichophorum]RZI46342.1 hypothetical protein EDM53_04265 [Rickettsiales endosymbiont of Peranema trichophorum]